MDVLKTHVDTLEHDAATDALLDLDAKGTRPYVEDCTCAPIVVAVRHALVIGTIHLDINILAKPIDAVVCRQIGHSVSAELARKAVARLAPISLAMRHRVGPAFRAALKMNLK